VTQGLRYVANLQIFDLVLPLVVVAVFLRSLVSKAPALRALAIGLALNAAYVIYIGGDFMSGRFSAAAYLTSAVTA
jgi:arabinofuranosyltransferase